MKLEMQHALNKEGKKALIGWSIIAENQQEELCLSEIRDWIFWGIKENGTYPTYEGRVDNKETNNVQSLRWGIRRNIKRYINKELFGELQERWKNVVDMYKYTKQLDSEIK